MNPFEGRPIIEQNAQLRVTFNGEMQDFVVPLEGIHETGFGTYIIYVIETRPGLFGPENFLIEKTVTVLYDNGRIAAIEGGFLNHRMSIAIRPSGPLRDGDTVWVRER